MRHKNFEKGQYLMGAEQLVSDHSHDVSSEESLGQYLIKQREDKKISLKQISRDTKINIKILEALENNNKEILPSRPYVRGFVISYCRSLQLNPREAIHLFENTYGSGQPKPVEEEFKSSSNDYKIHPTSESVSTARQVFETNEDLIERADWNKRISQTLDLIIQWKAPIAIALGLFVVMGIIITFLSSLKSEIKTANKIQESKVQEESKPADIKSSDKPLLQFDKTAQMRGEAPKDVKPQVAAAPVVAAPVAVAAQPVAPAPVIEKVEVKADPALNDADREFPVKEFTKIYGPLYTLDSRSPDVSNSEFYPESIREAAGVHSTEDLYIYAHEADLWAHYKVDDGKIKRTKIVKGGNLHLKGKLIRVITGDIRKAKIFYNGSKVVSNSTTGVRSFVFPEKEQSNYEIPLFAQSKGKVLYESSEYKKKVEEETAKLKKQ